MNTELIDYLKTLAKRELFFVSVANLFFSAVIIVCGAITLRTEATPLMYSIMFACATAVLALNAYKCFRRRSKNGWVFAALAVVFALITGICLYALFGGIE
ncbi:MAG: hypothetical protein IKE35_00895 [Lachnospiraceae bacterium]|nr:hypothetical protein [Lachnospiraceae bacterium]MBR2529562.1 hypothetical protein [Lachnospiraceae bacterium]